MANQQNYTTNVSTYTNATKFNASRIIGDMRDNLLEIEIPSKFDVDNYQDKFVELHVYSLADNQLIYSTILDNIVSDALKVNTITYDDGSKRSLLFIDFSKISTFDFPVGRYSVTLNFFSKEIGSHDDRPLVVNKISPSRTEIELLPNPENIVTAYNFVLPAITTEWVLDAMKQIFNQENNQDSRIPTIPDPMSKELLQQQLLTVLASTNVYINMDEVFSIAQSILDIGYIKAKARVEERLTSDKKRFTNIELNDIVTFSIQEAYDEYVFANSNQLNSLNYTI
jgi:hypothetical protein